MSEEFGLSSEQRETQWSVELGARSEELECAALCAELIDSTLNTPNSTLPERVLLLPAGEVAGRDGRRWKNAEPRAILRAFAELGRDLPIDIEHATELRAPKGEPAPAAAWITALENENGAIWGRVQWTPRGAALVGERQYRYLSPVILYRPADGVITGITSAALTNQPNLRLGALNRGDRGHLGDRGQGTGVSTCTLTPNPCTLKQGETNMETNAYQIALNAALGLPENAGHDRALNAVSELKAKMDAARADLADLEKFVPRADYDQALERAANAEKTLADERAAKLEGEIEAEIKAALEAGRITPATADYHRAACRHEGGLERFREFVKAAPVIAPDSGLDGKKPEDAGRALNAEDRRVCELMGIDESEYAKTTAA